MASAPRARMLTAFLFRLALRLTRRAARGDERKSLSTARTVLLFLALGALEAHPFRARVGFVGGLLKIERVETSCDVHNTLRQHPESELEIERDIYCLGNDRSSLFPSSLQNLRTKLQNLMGHQETCERTNQSAKKNFTAVPPPAVGGFGKMMTRAQSDQLTRRALAHRPRAVRIDRAFCLSSLSGLRARPAGAVYAASPLQKLR